MKHRHGLTLIELLAVVAIIALLVALLFPAVQAARESARRVQCANNIKQTALALNAYHASNNALPAGVVNRNPQFRSDSNAALRGLPDTWAAVILPFMEQNALHDRLDFTRTAGAAVNRQVITTPVPSFICPTDPSAAAPVLDQRCTLVSGAGRMAGIWYGASLGPVNVRGNCSFCANPSPSRTNLCCWGDPGFHLGINGSTPGMFANGPRAIRFDDVRDGLSNTILLGETRPGDTNHNGIYLSNWMTVLVNTPVNQALLPSDDLALGHQSNAAEPRANGIKSRHASGAFIALCDGSVQFLDESISFPVLCAIGTRKLGEAVVLP